MKRPSDSITPQIKIAVQVIKSRYLESHREAESIGGRQKLINSTLIFVNRFRDVQVKIN
jgi:hypothetical protein